MSVVEIFATIMAVLFVLIGLAGFFVKPFKKMYQGMGKSLEKNSIWFALINIVIAVVVLYYVWLQTGLAAMFAAVGATFALAKGVMALVPGTMEAATGAIFKAKDSRLQMLTWCTGIVGLAVLYFMYVV